MNTPTPSLRLIHKVGEIIANRYEVKEKIKSGGMGTVYKVYDKNNKYFYACKEMDILDDPATQINERNEFLEKFKREAENLKKLDNPYIPKAAYVEDKETYLVCPDCRETFKGSPLSPCHKKKPIIVKGRYYLIMEFVEGDDLEEKITKEGKPLKEKDVVKWTLEVSDALKTIHSVGMIHRDVKPDNIRIDNKSQKAYLLDMGLVKPVAMGKFGTVKLSQTGNMGTPGYAPTEQWKHGNPEQRTDIYALGMTMFRLLTNKNPLDQSDLAQIDKHPDPKYFNSNISDPITEIIKKAIKEKPEDRFTNITEFINSLQVTQPTVTATLDGFYEKREIKDQKELNEIKQFVSKWANGIPAHPYRQLGDAIKITSATEFPSHWVVLKTRYENRKVVKTQRPYRSGENVGTFTIEETAANTKKWEYPLKLKEDFPEDTLSTNYDVPGSSQKKKCEKCDGRGVIICSSCGGAGKLRCSKCNGHGHLICGKCDGNGQIDCPECRSWLGGRGDGTKKCFQCGGSGKVTRYSSGSGNYEAPCSRCGGSGRIQCGRCHGSGIITCTQCGGSGQVTCTTCRGSGWIICTTCSGSGQVTCDECEGSGYVVEFLRVECVYAGGIEDAIVQNKSIEKKEAFPPDFFRGAVNIVEEAFTAKLDTRELQAGGISTASYQKIADCTNNMIEKAATFPKLSASRIMRQYLTIQKIYTVKIEYTHNGKPYKALLAGRDRGVYHGGKSPIDDFVDDEYMVSEKFFNEKKYEKALSHLNIILEINHNEERSLKLKSKTLYEIAKNLFGEKKYEESVKTMDEALKITIEPEHTEATNQKCKFLFWWGRVLYFQRNFKLGWQKLSSAVKTNPTQEEAHKANKIKAKIIFYLLAEYVGIGIGVGIICSVWFYNPYNIWSIIRGGVVGLSVFFAGFVRINKRILRILVSAIITIGIEMAFLFLPPLNLQKHLHRF